MLKRIILTVLVSYPAFVVSSDLTEFIYKFDQRITLLNADLKKMSYLSVYSDHELSKKNILIDRNKHLIVRASLLNVLELFDEEKSFSVVKDIKDWNLLAKHFINARAFEPTENVGWGDIVLRVAISNRLLHALSDVLLSKSIDTQDLEEAIKIQEQMRYIFISRKSMHLYVLYYYGYTNKAPNTLRITGTVDNEYNDRDRFYRNKYEEIMKKAGVADRAAVMMEIFKSEKKLQIHDYKSLLNNPAPYITSVSRYYGYLWYLYFYSNLRLENNGELFENYELQLVDSIVKRSAHSENGRWTKIPYSENDRRRMYASQRYTENLNNKTYIERVLLFKDKAKSQYLKSKDNKQEYSPHFLF